MLSVTLTSQEKKQGLLWLLISQFLLPTLVLAGLSMILPQINTAQQNFVYYVINFLAVAVIFRRFWLSAIDALSEQIPQIIHAAIFGFLGYWAMNYALSSLITWIAPEFSNVNDSAVIQTFSENFTLMAIGITLLVPVAEEALYRGLIFGALSQKNTVLAYAVSILAFALIHVIGYIGKYDLPTLLLCLLQYFPAGFCLSWAYRKADNILAPILIHAAINTIGILSVR